MFHYATISQSIRFPKESLPQVYTEFEYSSLIQVHSQNYFFFIERRFKDWLKDFLYEKT